MPKVFWFDCETTGLNPKRNDIIELAYIIESDGEILESDTLLMRPEGVIDSAALKVNKRTVKEIMAFPPRGEGIANLRRTFAKHVNKFNKLDKFIPAGYNVRFDLDFLRAAFVAEGDKYFGSWFTWCALDAAAFVAAHVALGTINLPNYKLATVCKTFGIELVAHEAQSDIRATRDLYYMLKDALI